MQMQTMRISLVVQVILAALTLGACLGAVLPRLPDLVAVRAAPSAPEQPTPAAYALSTANNPNAGSTLSPASNGSLSAPPVAAPAASLQVQVRAEVQAAGNANAEAQALGPGNTQAKANTLGPGSSQAVAYSTDPNTLNLPTDPGQAPAISVNTARSSNAPLVPANFTTEPRAVVREPIVNLRSGPGTHYTIMGMATQGQQFAPLGRTLDGNWWKVCCYDQQLVWIAGQLTDLYGPVDNIEIVGAAPAPVVALPTATNPPPPPTPTTAPAVANLSQPNPMPSYEFSLVEKNQFAEAVTPRIFLYIAQGAEGLGGYTLQVKKDNTYLPVNVDTFNGPPAFTWPLPIARQRFHNLKVEFPGIQPEGAWEVQVVEDSTRKAVAAPVIFNLKPNDANQEMYISLRR